MRGKEKVVSSRVAITASRLPEAGAAALQSQLAAIIEATPDGVALINPQGEFRYLNPACRSMLGIGADEPVSALTLLDFCSSLARSDIQQNALPTASREGRWNAEVECINRSGRAFPVFLALFAHKETDTQVSLLSVILRDISEQKHREAELAHLAHHDALTGLFNRRRFQEELDNRLAQVRRYGMQGGLLFIDVDGLKMVNDTLGHQAGDALLVSLAALLQERLREVDIVARLGGDEFAVLISTADALNAPAVAERLLQAVQQHTTVVATHRLSCTISIGIALFPQHGVTAETIIERADLALYRAKTSGRNQYRMFSPEMKASQSGEENPKY